MDVELALLTMKIMCAKLAGGGGPGDQNRDIHLTFSGPRLQRGYRCYVTITKLGNKQVLHMRHPIFIACMIALLCQ